MTKSPAPPTSPAAEKRPDTQGFPASPVRRALLSVSDKTGLAEFARALAAEFGVGLISTGGTARHLRDAGLPVTDVSELTGFPEIMAGRVKTLHPLVHGGLLGRLPEDELVMREHDIAPIDLVCVNLYPFAQTIGRAGATLEDAVENIDIGGPSMIRSAAKNFRRVAVVTDPGQYDRVLSDLRENGGTVSTGLRQILSADAFRLTGRYDRLIADELAARFSDAEQSPIEKDSLDWSMGRVATLRYGENPHQKAALFAEPGGGGIASAEQLHGKELGYINVLDADAALTAVADFGAPAACVVKHATPCGLAAGPDLAGAVADAFAADPLAAFGGILAVNRRVDLAAAEAVAAFDALLEVVAAPAFDGDALQRLKRRWKNVRLLAVGDTLAVGDVTAHKVGGGLLVQERDVAGVVEEEWKVVTDRQPTDAERAALRFAWLACKHVKSNAVVVAGATNAGHATRGIGGGQVDRVAAAEQAVRKAGDKAAGAVAASDAFFPFPDGPEALLDAGVTAIVQPGGSVRDAETVELCNARNATMIFTGRRHFRH